ncbi:MAG TPA: xanthine dehydrogenase family protein subunit M [Candidatus Eisenbacteria bacterium]|nr:xanthine dehydrogenase family protein subunit M [Candidatus Eisenbacteria bacterium]
MLPAAFEYATPGTLDEALALLDQHADDGKVLAGGQSLIPLLKLRLASPAFLIDINRVPGLDTLEERDGALVIGALVRHKTAERSSLLANRYAVLAEAAPQVADPLVRNRGTLAGSLAHADPSGDWGSVMLAVDAEFVLRSRGGSRTVKARDFFNGPFSTVLQPNEILTEIRIPARRGPTGGAYLKLERKVGDFATVGVAIHLQMDDGKVREAGIALTAVGPQNIQATEAEAALKGQTLNDNVIKKAGQLAAKAAAPRADLRGSEAYKRNVVRVFTERGLKRAYEQARGGG